MGVILKSRRVFLASSFDYEVAQDAAQNLRYSYWFVFWLDTLYWAYSDVFSGVSDLWSIYGTDHYGW